ncbi:MAG: glycosyltransferase family 39 protein [Anaerolineaceae bacterium]|nr:glycosyltransferase family 39 protein [Anaerolineaceae bacterium]
MSAHSTSYFNSCSLDTNSDPKENIVRSLANFIKQHHIGLIILISVLMRLPFVLAPEIYGFQGASWRQADTASIAHNFIASKNILFPQINWGGNGPGYVETEFQFYPFTVSMLYQVFGEHVSIGLFVSLVFSTGSLIFFYALARNLLSSKAATIALIFFAASPLFTAYSVVFMPEPTVLFFYMAAFYLFMIWLQKQNFVLLLLAGVATALAILVKPTSIHIGFVFLFLVIEKYKLRFLKDYRLWLFAIISLLPGVIWYLHARDLYLDYGNTFGVISGGDSKFDNLRYWLSPEFYLSILEIDLVGVFAIGGVFPFAIGVVVARLNRKYRVILYGAVSILIYYLIIPRYISFANYYHIFALPYAALGIGLGLDWLFEPIRYGPSYGPALQKILRHKFILSSVFVLLIALITLRAYIRYLIPSQDPLWQCSQVVAQTVPESALVIISSTTVSENNGVPNNYQKPQIFFYSHRYGWSLAADQHTPEQIAEYHELGGQYFVIYSQDLFQSNPQLVSYLDQTAQQVGPGIENSCAIYQFK